MNFQFQILHINLASSKIWRTDTHVFHKGFYYPFILKALSRTNSSKTDPLKPSISSNIISMMKKMEVKLSLLVCFSIFVGFGFLSNGCSAAKEPEVGAYELKKGKLSMTVTNYGARIMSVILPDKYGKLGDIALGFDTAKEYTNNTSNFGAIVGRVANRIAGAQFTLNGTLYKLIPNSGNNTIHGGPKGFARVIWQVKKYQKKGDAPHIVLAYHSVDGDQGFPGDLLVTLTYTLLSENEMSVVMKAKALNKATPVNLAQHTFWNLGGHDSGDILGEEIQIFASRYTPVNSQNIPTGKIASVKGTAYDFLKPSTIGSKITKLPQGYDINYALDGKAGKRMKIAAIVRDKKSGRVMELFTDQPGMQFFTSNTLNQTGKGGFLYRPYAALCLETQGYPDAVNHPNFPSTILTPGNTYKHYMLFKFSTK